MNCGGKEKKPRGWVKFGLNYYYFLFYTFHVALISVYFCPYMCFCHSRSTIWPLAYGKSLQNQSVPATDLIFSLYFIFSPLCLGASVTFQFALHIFRWHKCFKICFPAVSDMFLQSEHAGSGSYRFFCPVHAGLPVHRVIAQLNFVGFDPVPAVTETEKDNKYVVWKYINRFLILILPDLQMELRPCRMTPVNRVGCMASTSSHWFWSLYSAHQAPSYRSPSSMPDWKKTNMFHEFKQSVKAPCA